jgi:8-oxo-dGTP pyrophosphatase MutT (NUDIX family)
LSFSSQVEQGESLTIALKREIREELGAEIKVKGLFMHPFPCDYSEDKGEGCITLFPMICTLWADSPYPSTREGIHDNLNWVSADALEEYHML